MIEGLDHLRFITPREVLERIGKRVISFIPARTLAGKDVNDRDFAPYSTKPFARPMAGITAKARDGLKGSIHPFTTKAGKLWAIIEGGYAAYKRAAYPQYGDTVNLTQKFQMLRALTIVRVDEASGTIVIGFTRPEEAQKAYWNELRGRRFMGVTEREADELRTMAAGGIRIE